ncbi:MAG: alpha/beta fold hydrolase [Bacteroidota bacterium]
MQNDFTIKCGDGKIITATHFGFERSPIVIISPALGTSRKYYDKFAKSLFETGFQVITFDYRGIGESSSNLSDSDASLTNWGEQDLTAVIQWAYDHNPTESISLVGHSIAGQLFPLAKNKNLVKAAYFVASQTASSFYWETPQRWRVKLFWNLVLPTTTSLTGKLPSWAYGGKYDLPRDAAEEWAEWGNHKNGVMKDCPYRMRAFKNVTIPLRFISMDDDKMLAPRKAVERLYQQYGSTAKEHHHWYPDEFGRKSIGHFGFFRSENEEMWQDAHLWLKRYI